MEITLQLFGAYRSFGSRLTLDVADGARVADLRPALKQAIAVKEGLVDSSRFATEEALLADDAPLCDGAVLAVIPPVSGG